MFTNIPATAGAPLSAAQKELWYWQKKEPLSAAYNEGLVFELAGIDADRLQTAFNRLAQRHPVLRTVYVFADGGPVAVLTNNAIDFEVVNVDEFNEEEIRAEYNAAFDLSKSVMRIRLYAKKDGPVWMLATVHHIACDGWSLKIMWNELIGFYMNDVQPEAVNPGYADFVAEEINYLQSEAANASLEFWQKGLEEVSMRKNLLAENLIDRKPAAAHYTCALELEQLRLAAHEMGGSLFEALLCIYHLSICYFTREKEVLIGTPFFNRANAYRQVAGYFVNAVGLRNEINIEEDFAAHFSRVHVYMKQAVAHSAYPFNLLQAGFQYFFSVRNRLFDISLPAGYKLHDILFKSDPQFGLHLEVYEGKQGAKAVFHYDESLVEEEAVQQLAARFKWLCEWVVASPKVSIRELMQLPAQELAHVKALGKGEVIEYKGNYSKMFKAQVKKTPGNIAIRDAKQSLTYSELNELVNKLKKNLPDAPVVAVCMERCCELVATAIAIWDAGKTYMPIDPSLPQERIDYMLKDSGAVLTGTGGYLLYTSGSTGQPKGVMVSAKGMFNHLRSKLNDLALNEETVVAQTASVSFDVSIWQTFAVLLAGGSIRIYSKEEVLDLRNHVKQLKQDEVSIVQMVPSYLQEFLKEAESIPSVKYLVSAGEPLEGELANAWFNAFPGTHIANCYGPTEAADNISIHIFNECEPGLRVPSGRAIDNMQLYVVDSWGNLCQPGVTGEIWVSGVGVAKSYIGDAKERSSVFMADPFCKNRWLYKTGDLGKFENGLLHFSGRKDRQVKLRGQRVELGEIENSILRSDAVKQAAVVYNEGTLAAYIVWQNEARELFLKDRLPAYMIPSQIISLDEMPLTASGKLDRKRLPVIANMVTEATNAHEANLLAVWKQVLNKENIGIHHDFFEHGGHSLKAMQLISQIEQEQQINLSFADLLAHPTVASLAKFIEGAAKQEIIITPAPEMELYPATGQQQLIWNICNTSREAAAAYNMIGAMRFNTKPTLKPIVGTTNFKEENGKLWQIIRNEEIDIAVVETDDLKTEVQQYLEEEKQFVFDLEYDVLVRLTLFVSPNGTACLAGNIHHLVADGISLQLLLSQADQQPAFEYKDYACWQQRWLQSAQAQASKDYFNTLLSDAEPLHLPIDHTRPVNKSFKGGSAVLNVSNVKSTTLITAIQLLLEAFSGQEKLVTGIVLTGRPRASWNQQVGLFMNTLPMVLNISGEDSLAAVAQRVQDQLTQLQDQQLLPLHALMQERASYAPLLSKVLINYMRFDNEGVIMMGLPGLQLTAPASKAELEFECYETRGAVSCRLIYDADLFSNETAEQLLQCLEVIIDQCVNLPSMQVKDLHLVANKHQLLQASHGAVREYPVNIAYADLFKASAKQFENALAVSDGQTAFTYSELDALSDGIAAKINLPAQSIVAACVHRNAYLPAVILGIWKAGCIYLPLDPSHPEQRNNYILENAGASLIIREGLQFEQLHNNGAANNGLSYIIYTSGSTGKPKGVKVEQRGMINHLYSRIHRFGLDSKCKLAQIASHTFDISIWQMFAPLLVGAQVHMFTNVQDVRSVAKQLREKNITHLQVVPTYLSELLQVLQTTEKNLRYPQLKMVATIGEELKRSLADKWMQRLPGVKLFNTYGPTEASDTICDHEVLAGSSKLPVGKPIDNLTIEVFDKHFRLCPPAIAGEICVSGIGVGQGYIGLPEKTAASFKNGMYRTGDTGRWNSNYELEFLGRTDTQVKLAGYRIELAEIEQCIAGFAGVSQAAVIVRNQILLAYVVGTTNGLSQHLAAQLPAYMVPAQIIGLTAMPLTSSGKIDRKQLPEPGMQEEENMLAPIWRSVLAKEQVGINDNFFALGGNSIKAAAVLTAIETRFGCKLQIANIFSHPTMAALSKLVVPATEKKSTEIEHLPDAAHYAVSPSQKRIWVMSQLNSRAYNIAGAWQFNSKIDVNKLKLAIAETVQRHESLRTGFCMVNEELRQFVVPNLPAEEYFVDEDVFNYEFDLSKPGLLRIQLAQNKISCAIHHSVCDGWSVQQLMQEISDAYLQKTIPAPAIQYRDYAEWLNKQLNTGSEKYWLPMLDKAVPLQLVTDHARPAIQSFDGNFVSFSINKNKLSGFAQQQNMSVFMLLVSAVKLLLFRYSNQQNITVGSAVAGRENPATQNMIGCCINTILITASVHPTSLVSTFLQSVRETMLSAYAHQAYPLDLLADKFIADRDISRNAFFDVLVNHQYAGGNESIFNNPEKYLQYSRLDLEFNFTEDEDSLQAELIYNTAIFNKQTIETYAAQLNTLLEALTTGDTVSNVLSAISIAKDELLRKGRGRIIDHPVHEGYSRLFMNQALLHTNNIAVRDHENVLSYSELADLSTRVAGKMREVCVETNPVVAVCLPRNCKLPAIAIGIWHMGGIYMPIDPALPMERIDYMLKNANASMLICEDGMPVDIKQCKADELLASDRIIEFNTRSDYDGSYLLYTSGSTGRPKGVLVSAQGMLNHLHSKLHDLELDKNSIVAQTASVGFDISIWQTFAVLLNGGSIRIYSKSELLDVKNHFTQLKSDGITIAQMVPSYLGEIVEEAETNKQQLSFSYLLSVGEEIDSNLAARCLKVLNGRLVNSYGPTEASDNITMQFIDESMAGQKVPVGRAIDNMQLYVVDEAGNLCQPGITGEIWVSGIGVAKGYIGNARERSAEVFMPDPFMKGRWLYKTGDLGKWDARQDVLHFNGRKDRQVKLRGQRVELAEIESVIQKCEAVKQSAVVHNAESIAAYIVWKDKASTEQLQTFLRGQLPAYMIPAHIISLNEMPLTPSGKLDRKQLPAVEAQTVATATNEIEEALLQVWRKVLSKEDLGIQHNFFEYGGHSLKAIRLVGAVERELGMSLKLQDVFMHPTVQSQAKLLIRSTAAIISPAPQATHYPLSAAQKRMWVVNQLGEDGYNICGALQLNGELNIAAWENAWSQLMQRHEIFRTVYFLHEGEPRQQIVTAAANISHVKGGAIDEIYRQHEQTRFNLETGPVVRATLVHVSEQQFFFVFALHHIAADEWTLSILFKEIIALYNNEQPPVKLQYKDYAVWEQEPSAESKHYWEQALADLKPLELPADFSNAATNAGASAEIELPTTQLQQLCKANNSTLFMGLVASVHALLFRYCHQNDIRTGIPVSTRSQEQLQDSVGLFLNTLVLHSQPNDEQSFTELLQQIKTNTLNAFAHKDFPFERLGRNDLFDVSIVLHEEQAATSINNLQIAPYKGPVTTSKFDLSFQFTSSKLELIYNTERFTHQRIQSILEHYSELLNAALSFPTRPIGKLEYIPAHERIEVQNITIPENICAQIIKNKCSVAGIDCEQLNEQAIAFAAYLQTEHEVQPGDVVAIKMERSVELIIAIIGILKTGAAYLPIDKSLPQQRIDYILQDSNAKTLITKISTNNQQYVEVTRQSNSIAYIIYTSGTTGKPKGVRITDHSLLHYVAGITQAYGLNNQKALLASSVAFDLGYTCLWGTLLGGGELHLAKETAYWDPREILNQVQTEKINFIKLTPSHFRLLLNETLHGQKGGENLSLIILGGEKIVPAEVRQWLELFPHCRIANHYGPTEATIGVLTQLISLDNISQFEKQPVLGKPMGNHVMYVVDERSEPCGNGVWGELWIGGPGLSPGYVNLPELTAQKFIDDPFRRGHKVYRTGDKARWLNGCIAFAGRIDEQVQLKGYRVEPAEIEMALLQCEGVTTAAARVVTIQNEQQLVAYAVCANFDEEKIKSHLRNLLPVYMLPWRIIQLSQMPLTPNGKIDKKALPLPVADTNEKHHRQPATRAEEALLSAFITIFKTDQAHIGAHFFESGGDSIKAIQLSSLLYHNGWELEVKTIFQHPVLEHMAAQMQPLSDEHPFIHAPAGEHYEVSAAQRRLWFINQLEDNPTVYNMLSALAIEGAFNQNAFAAAVRELVQRHEILRTVFLTVNNLPRQKIMPYDERIHSCELVDLSVKQNSNALLEEIFRADGQLPFDLATGPLFRLKLVRMRADLHLFIMNLHHIIYDGWSKNVLEEEFLELFRSYSNNKTFALPQPAYQYKDYSAWQSKYFSGNAASKHRDYWMEQLKGELPVLQIPSDRPRPPVKTYASRKITAVIPAPVTEKLNQLAGEENTTGFTIVLSAIQILLKRYSGQDDIITGIPSAGRSRPEVNRMAGLFFNLLPIRTQFNEKESFLSVIQKLKQQTGDAYEHGDYPFDHLVEQLRLQRDLSRSALFDVLVVSQDFGAPAMTKHENGFTISEVDTGFSGNKFDLTFYFRKEEKGLSMTIGYNAILFNHDRMERLCQHFLNLLKALVFFPANDILSSNYLTAAEAEEMRVGFNNTIRPYSGNKLLHQLFEETAAEYPVGEALRQNGMSLSYQCLNSSANIIARRLLLNSVKNGDNIGILTGRNFSMIQGMLGILKAGAAYVPIDPAYPADRQRYIITNSEIHFLVTDDASIAENAIAGLNDIVIIDLTEEVMLDDSNLSIEKSPTDLAYTIYTSGSSGRPKGVMIEHHSAVNLVEWVNKEFHIGRKDRMLFITSMCFDLSVYDIFGILAAGGCIVIATMEDVQDIASIKQLLLQERISFWDTVPTTLNYLVTELEHSKQAFVQHDLKVAFLSGDWIPVTLPSLAKKFFPNVQVISLGGATEGTVWSNYFPVKEVDAKWMSIPYGKPITNNFFYILDAALNPVPQGVAGELFIGGVGVSRGYINDPVKTAAAFMDDPFSKDLGGRMYRTGDLGRMLPDGNMEFLGRKDFQVKIRGFRVELGEIEQVMSKFPGIQSVLVNATQDNNGIKFLVAYYLGDDQFTKGALTAFLSKRLPDYMIPAFFIRMESFPLNTNGKIDRKALPHPVAAEEENALRLLPRTPTEVAVSGIWSRVLNKELLGVQDNFFMLGGHSLTASQVVARIREEMDVPLKLPSIFINPTIEGLSNEIDALKWARKETAQPATANNKIII